MGIPTLLPLVLQTLEIRARKGVDLEAEQRNAPAGKTENRTLALKSAPKKGPYSGPVLVTAEPKL